MHSAALQLAPLAAEKDKTPFYIAGGLLVAWALIVSVASVMRRPNFPSSLTEQRVLMGISAVLVLAAVATAVLTAGTPVTVKVQPVAHPIAGGAEETTPAHTTTTPPSAPATTPTASAPATTPAATSPPPAAVGASPNHLTLAANPAGALSYNTKQLSAKAGTVTIQLTNNSPLEHNVTIAEGSKVLGATPTFLGGTRTLTLTLKPGTYTFYCSVPGHRMAGMEGTLSVS